MRHEADQSILDADLCYTAVRSRDARFDGRFFTAVETTGIYCRPICPARTPRRDHVRFFACAAAAEEAGFRPCLRCRPETAPGTPAWQGASSAVSRALRLIGEGALDEGDVEGLAERVGLGERHLRRLFQQHLGASPLSIAQTRRVHFARRLVDETGLPVAEVAFSAGFSSVRRFNAAFKKVYGRPPSALRSASRQVPTPEDPTIRLRLAYRRPFDWEASLRFLGTRALPGVELVTASAYRRTISLDGRRGVIEVAVDPGRESVILSVPTHMSRAMLEIVARTKRLFDLEADPKIIAEHFSDDPLLSECFTRNPGLRIPGAWDGFEVAVRAILGQQVSVAHAVTLAERLVKRFGESSGAQGTTHLFPEPERLAGAPVEEIGLPESRAKAIRHLAGAVLDGSLELAQADRLETTIDRLTTLPGVGDWTAQYIALRALGEPDAFPAGDLVLRRAAGRGEREFTTAQLIARAEAWRPWRAYAAVHLWASSQAGIQEERTRG